MLRWFVGLGPKPTFERWTYWEKFDLWAASADIVLIGTTGLILWFPNEFCVLLPGQALNIADLIHGKLALLATGFVFAIHFFSVSLRPEKFPMDISILTGLVSEEEMEEERPELVRRLRESGQLEWHLATAPSRRTLLLTMLGGFLALSLGLALLAAIVVAML
jgi:cytochrome b subunit of formate dehydrogenase